MDPITTFGDLILWYTPDDVFSEMSYIKGLSRDTGVIKNLYIIDEDGSQHSMIIPEDLDDLQYEIIHKTDERYTELYNKFKTKISDLSNHYSIELANLSHILEDVLTQL